MRQPLRIGCIQTQICQKLGGRRVNLGKTQSTPMQIECQPRDRACDYRCGKIDVSHREETTHDALFNVHFQPQPQLGTQPVRRQANVKHQPAKTGLLGHDP